MDSEYELSPMLDEIADVIGRDNVEKLIEHFGGAQIYITSRRRLCLKSRNMQICEARKKGESAQSLARRFGLSTSWINGIIQEYRKEHGGKAQHDLFS